MALADLPAGPLVSADWLAENLGQPGLAVIDTREGGGYLAGHVPGALKLGVEPVLKRPDGVIEPEVFAAEMIRLGIGPQTLVVAYDAGANLFGARLWWVLRHYGHDRVRVLDGGWDGWVAAGRQIETQAAPVPHPGTFTARLQSGLMAEMADVRAAMDDPNRQILDVRGPSEWLRQTPTQASLAGHVPGACHVVWTDVMDPDSHGFLPPEALRDVLSRARLRMDAPVIAYCHGGVRAAHAVLALEHAGLFDVRNYEGSWAEWSSAGMPATVEALPDQLCEP